MTRKVRVFGSYRNLSVDAVRDLDVVIVDVLRATTTIAFAVDRGARVLPLASIDDALARGRELGDRAILVGERMGAPLPGFHCNNSPREIAALELRDRIVVLTTTNGTQAVAACAPAARIFAAALTNAPATGRALDGDRDVAIVCAGRNTGALAYEDLVGAGAVVAAVADVTPNVWIADGARVALELFERSRAELSAALRRSDAAHELVEKGGGEDVDHAATHGSIAHAAMLRSGMFETC